MRAGSLRHRITIRRRTNTPDGAGGWTPSWTNVGVNLPADIVSINGKEAMVGQVLQSINTYKVTIRYMTGIKPADQITWDDGEELNILSCADPDGKRQRIEIIADTKTPQGA